MFQSILTVSGRTTWTELPLKFNELLTHLLTFYITCQVLKLELCKFHQVAVSCPAKATRRKYYNVLYVKANIKRAGKYFAGNFGRGKEWELNIPSQKCIRIIDLWAELPECWINLPPQTNSIQFNLTFGHFMWIDGVYPQEKNNRFPILDILGYLQNTHKNPKFGKVRQVPTRFPGWDLSHSSKFGIFVAIL